MNLTKRILIGIALVFLVNGGFVLAVLEQPIWPEGLELTEEGLRFTHEDIEHSIYPHFFVGSAKDMRKYYHKNKRQYFSDRATVYRFLKHQKTIEQDNTHPAITVASGLNTEKYETNIWEKAKHLTTSFWIRLSIGFLAVIAAYIIWVARPQSQAGTIFLLSSIMLMLCQWSSALDSTSPTFFLHPIFAWLISLGNGLGTVGYACFGSMCVIYFPSALDNHKQQTSIVGIVFACAFCFIAFRGVELGIPLHQQLYLDNHYLYLCALLAYPFILYFCLEQRRASRSNAARRALSNWVIFSWLFGPGIFLALHALPSYIGMVPLIPRSLASLLLYSNFIFMLIALARLPYLQLEKHVSFILRWVAIVCLLLFLEISILRILNSTIDILALLTIILGITFYIPLREGLIRRLSKKRRKVMSSRFAEASALLTRASMLENENQQDVWRSALQVLFEPIAVRTENNNVDPGAVTISLSHNNTCMTVQATAFTPTFFLEHPDHGERLFDKQDAILAESISQLFTKLQTLRNSYQKGQKEERNRIRTDLHDQISHNLINLIYSSKDNDTQNIARTILDDLRTIITALESEAATAQVFSDRAEAIAKKILDACEIQLCFNVKVDADLIMTPTVSLNLLNSLRELLTNTIKHAEASEVTIDLQFFKDKRLKLVYADNGRGIGDTLSNNALATGSHLGLENISQRIKTLDGDFNFRTGGSFRATMDIPLN